MFDKYLIESKGFNNFHDHGALAGYEFGLRIAYYRGVALAILSGLRVWVDGAEVDAEKIRLVVDGRSFSLNEAACEEDVRWAFDRPIKVRVLQLGGLPDGTHQIRVHKTIKPAYMPPTVGFVGECTKSVTLVGADAALPTGLMLGVSLYSYQEEFYTRAMTLDECFAEVASIGAQGVQLIAEQMVEAYPKPSSQWIERWHNGLTRHGLVPTMMDSFVDIDCGGHRRMSLDESVAKLVQQMELAKLLGFSIIRPTTGPVEDSAPELIERALEHAERLGVTIAPEIHAPIELTGPYIASYLELIEKSGTSRLGFTLDLGIFCREIPEAARAQALRHGAQPELVEYINASFMRGMEQREVLEFVQANGGSEAAVRLARHYRAFGPPKNRIEDLARILPHVKNVHGKFYVMSDDLAEPSIPYREILKALVAGGYQGAIDSEYEGQRLTQDAFQTDSCEQVRRHHLMMRRLLAESAA